MSTYDLQGKVALVTGAARGIGLGTAKALTARGARVVVLDLDQDAADRAAAELGGEAFGLAADVTDSGALQRAVATIVERFGHLDVVVANAGIANTGATLRAMSGEAFDRVLDVNGYGVVRTVQAALPEIVRNRGHVVVIASVYAFMNGVGVTPYAMSKAAVEQLGRALRVELAPFGASATVAYFGFIDTEMVHKGIDEDPLADQLWKLVPRPLQKRLPPAKAGEAIAVGIERRSPKVIQPRRWTVLSVLRGVLNPLLDRYMERSAETHAMVRTMDAREGQEQPTTA